MTLGYNQLEAVEIQYVGIDLPKLYNHFVVLSNRN